MPIKMDFDPDDLQREVLGTLLPDIKAKISGLRCKVHGKAVVVEIVDCAPRFLGLLLGV